MAGVKIPREKKDTEERKTQSNYYRNNSKDCQEHKC